MRPRRILFCTDFSENSVLAGQYALDFAKIFNSGLLVLHVLKAPQDMQPALPGDAAFDVQRDLLSNIEADIKRNLEKIRVKMVEDYEDVSTYQRRGVPVTEIMNFVKDLSIDLIVMGTHGRTGLKHLVMGSCAQNVVRMAKCPVLTVKPRDSRNPFL